MAHPEETSKKNLRIAKEALFFIQRLMVTMGAQSTHSKKVKIIASVPIYETGANDGECHALPLLIHNTNGLPRGEKGRKGEKDPSVHRLPIKGCVWAIAW